MNYKCFTDLNSYIKLETLSPSPLQQSSIDKSVKLPNYHSSIMSLNPLNRQKILGSIEKYIAFAIQGGQMEIRERKNHENRCKIQTYLPITQSILDFIMFDEDINQQNTEDKKNVGKLFVLTSDEQLLVYQLKESQVSVQYENLLSLDLEDHYQKIAIQLHIFNPYCENQQSPSNMIVAYNSEVLRLTVLSDDLKSQHMMRLWTLKMIFGQQGPLPLIQQVQISPTGLIYVMDTVGRITIINKDLQNDENGVIFVFKKSFGSKQFHILDTQRNRVRDTSLDLVQTFKRAKLLEPFDIILTQQDNELRLYDLSSKYNKKEGSCEIISNVIFDQKIVDFVYRKDFILAIFNSGNNQHIGLIKISEIHQDSQTSTLLKFSQISLYYIPHKPSEVLQKLDTTTQQQQIQQLQSEATTSLNISDIDFICQQGKTSSNKYNVQIITASKCLTSYVTMFVEQNELYNELQQMQKIPKSGLQEKLLSKAEVQKLLKIGKASYHAYSSIVTSLIYFGASSIRIYRKLCLEVRESKRQNPKVQLELFTTSKPQTQVLEQSEEKVSERVLQINDDNFFYQIDQQINPAIGSKESAIQNSFNANLQILQKTVTSQVQSQIKTSPLTKPQVQPQLLQQQVQQQPPLFSDKQLQRIIKLSNQQLQLSQQITQSMEKSSQHIKKQVKALKQTQNLVKQSVTLQAEIICPTIIKQEFLQIQEKYLSKSQVYYQNSQKQGVNDMFKRLQEKLLNSEQSLGNQRSGQNYIEENPQSAGLQNQINNVQDKQVDLIEGLTTQCSDLFQQQLSQIIKNTVEQVNQQFIIQPFKEMTQNFVLASEQQMKVHEQRYMEVENRIQSLIVGDEQS
eukprot:403364535